MRWFRPPRPKWGDTRVRTRFLLFPKTIGRETRWLERASWFERYEIDRAGPDHWYACWWIDEEAS